ncbi:MAG: hypothetical protein IJS70_10125 [Bacteroidales bacterium]|nr:hypothetical protein [Bacteroidales bacterium]
MKKTITIAFCALAMALISTNLSAVEDPDPRGSLRVGAHLGPDFVIGMSSGLTIGPALYLTGDYVLVDSWWIGHFTVGAALGGTHVGNIKMDSGVETRTNLFIAPRATYGINLSDRIELHIGLVSGPYLNHDQVRLNDGTKKYDHPLNFRWDVGGLFGARFSLNDRFGLSAEFNTASFHPYLSVGAVYRLF